MTRILHSGAPRAILGRLQANARRPGRISFPPAVERAAGIMAGAEGGSGGGGFVRELGEAFTEFRAQHEATVAELRGQIDGLNAAADEAASLHAAARVGAGTRAALSPEDRAYAASFDRFMRGAQGAEGEVQTANATGDRRLIQAAMSEGAAGSGGYVTPVEWDRRIGQEQRVFSPMRRLATVRQTGVGGYSTLWSDGLWGSGWVGETAARPQTTTPNLSPITFSSGTLYAQPAVTQDLLEDAQFDLQGWLANEVSETFALQEGIAFISGDGVNKPRGLLTDATHPGGAPVTVTTAAATGITFDDLNGVIYSLSSAYRANGAWLMASTTANALAVLKDGQGRPLWQPALTAGQPATLLGFPVETEENMPATAPGSVPIAFGDFRRAYVINDRLGTTVLRDPYSSKPYVLFYTRKRVGGGISDPKAIRFLKVKAS